MDDSRDYTDMNDRELHKHIMSEYNRVEVVEDLRRTDVENKMEEEEELNESRSSNFLRKDSSFYNDEAQRRDSG